MRALYRSNNEYLQHSHAIHSLANLYHVKESLVREVYEKVLQDFVSTAKLRKYLIILVPRQVKNLLTDKSITLE